MTGRAAQIKPEEKSTSAPFQHSAYATTRQSFNSNFFTLLSCSLTVKLYLRRRRYYQHPIYSLYIRLILERFPTLTSSAVFSLPLVITMASTNCGQASSDHLGAREFWRMILPNFELESLFWMGCIPTVRGNYR